MDQKIRYGSAKDPLYSAERLLEDVASILREMSARSASTPFVTSQNILDDLQLDDNAMLKRFVSGTMAFVSKF